MLVTVPTNRPTSPASRRPAPFDFALPPRAVLQILPLDMDEIAHLNTRLESSVHSCLEADARDETHGSMLRRGRKNLERALVSSACSIEARQPRTLLPDPAFDLHHVTDTRPGSILVLASTAMVTPEIVQASAVDTLHDADELKGPAGFSSTRRIDSATSFPPGRMTPATRTRSPATMPSSISVSAVTLMVWPAMTRPYPHGFDLAGEGETVRRRAIQQHDQVGDAGVVGEQPPLDGKPNPPPEGRR